MYFYFDTISLPREIFLSRRTGMCISSREWELYKVAPWCLTAWPAKTDVYGSAYFYVFTFALAFRKTRTQLKVSSSLTILTHLISIPSH